MYLLSGVRDDNSLKCPSPVVSSEKITWALRVTILAFFYSLDLCGGRPPPLSQSPGYVPAIIN